MSGVTHGGLYRAPVVRCGGYAVCILCLSHTLTTESITREWHLTAKLNGMTFVCNKWLINDRRTVGRGDLTDLGCMVCWGGRAGGSHYHNGVLSGLISRVNVRCPLAPNAPLHGEACALDCEVLLERMRV